MNGKSVFQHVDSLFIYTNITLTIGISSLLPIYRAAFYLASNELFELINGLILRTEYFTFSYILYDVFICDNIQLSQIHLDLRYRFLFSL